MSTRLHSVPDLVPEPAEPYVRRDKRGRRIGANWWRELIMSQYNAAWHDRDEREQDNHQMEPAEFAAYWPKPRLKDFLVGNAGLWRDADDADDGAEDAA